MTGLTGELVRVKLPPSSLPPETITDNHIYGGGSPGWESKEVHISPFRYLQYKNKSQIGICMPDEIKPRTEPENSLKMDSEIEMLSQLRPMLKYCAPCIRHNCCILTPAECQILDLRIIPEGV